MLKNSFFWTISAGLVVLSSGYYYYSTLAGGEEALGSVPAPIRISCLVGGPDEYWQTVITGAKDAAKQFGAELNIVVPQSTESSTIDQTKALSRINDTICDGVMLSPLDPARQTRLISTAATQVFVVTFDNEAPDAIAHYHVGADNKTAGQLVSDLVRRALPEGGEIALFVGDITRETARTRRQVLINDLANRPVFDPVSDNPNERIEAGDFAIVGTYLDDRSAERARANADKALQEHPELKCMVGLYSKNGPACAEAIEAAGNREDVAVVAFDQLAASLSGIRDGKIVGSVVQDPYSYGFESVRLLRDIHSRRDKTAPTQFNGRLTVPCQIVDADNLEEYQAKFKSQLED